jgi:hypothetical protein
VVHGESGKVIKGNSLTAVSDLPFAGMSTFGSSFLNKFEAAVVNAPLLQNLTIVDTPGVLSGEKQRISRGYDFSKVCRWFAERSDLILLLFDSYKLDISDEFRGVIEELHTHDDKVHCILNKADQLDSESLMRVYGALLWSMGKIFRGAEVTRVYVGSFNNEPLVRPEYTKLFEKDRNVLMAHLKELPKMCGMRKINEMVKRIRLNIVNVCLVGYLRSKMPWFWGKEAMQKRLLNSLDEIYVIVQHEYGLSPGDFPPINEFKRELQLQDFSTFPHSDRKVLQQLKHMIDKDVPKMLQKIAGVSKNSYDSGVGEEEDKADGGSDEADDTKDADKEVSDGKTDNKDSKKSSQASKKDSKKKSSGPGSAILTKLHVSGDKTVSFMKDHDVYVNIAIVILVIALAVALLYFKDGGETMFAYIEKMKAVVGAGKV